MAQKRIHLVADRWFAQLNANVDSSTTTWVLKSSGATGLPVPSSLQDTIVHCGSEKALVTAIAEDTPSAGLDSLTVTRGYGGSTAASHSEDAFVGHYFYEDYHNDVATRLAMAEYLLWTWFGATNGRIQGGLWVQAEGTPSMTVDVTAGAAFAAGQLVALRAATTLTFIAPVSNPRIDTIQIDQDGNVERVAGTEAGSPSAPAIDADALKLAEVYLRVGATSVKDTDDASNGYITNTENYL